MILNGVAVPRPSFTLIPSSNPIPGYKKAVSRSVIAGEGAVKYQVGFFDRAFLSQSVKRKIRRSIFLILVAEKYPANSPKVQLCRIGMDHLPINEEQFFSSNNGPSAKSRSPLMGLGRSSMIRGLLNAEHASIA